jgi:hypothetical protein
VGGAGVIGAGGEGSSTVVSRVGEKLWIRFLACVSRAL